MIHHVFANRSNVGDWLSARGIQNLLRPERVVEHFCDDPFVPETLDHLSRLGPEDLVVIGGGGLFMDYFIPFWEGFLRLAPRLRYCIWGVGYCDLKDEPSPPEREILERVVGGSRYSVVRDDLSLRHLENCALPAPVPCPSMVAVRCEPMGSGLLHVDNYTTVGAAAYDSMDRHCRDFAARTGRVYRRTNNRIDPPTEPRLGLCLERYSRSDLVVSSALHGCVIAVAMGRPVVAVSGDYKIESFMEAAGLGEWVVDAAEVEKVPALLERLSSQPLRLDFAARARAENEGVARRVKEVAAETAFEHHV